MSNTLKCYEIRDDIIRDCQTLIDELSQRIYLRPITGTVKSLAIARRRVRIAMTKLGVNYESKSN